MLSRVNSELRAYIEQEIIPRYDNFDAAHRRNHVETVIQQSLQLAIQHDVDIDMAYTIAAYHDTGLCFGRENHHRESRLIVLADQRLKQWFTPSQIATMAEAVEDHRASSKSAPRTIYGRIVAEADRIIEPLTIIRRTIQYTLEHHPSLDREEGYERMVAHLNEKYNYGGYLKLWIENSENGARLEELRKLIANKSELRNVYNTIFDEETTI